MLQSISLGGGITAKYNLGCCYFDLKDFGNASLTFKDIIKEESGYVDAFCKLAQMAE